MSRKHFYGNITTNTFPGNIPTKIFPQTQFHKKTSTKVLGIDSAGYAVGDDFNQMMKADGNTETFEFFNLVAYIPPFLVIVIIAIMVIFGIVQLVKNPKGSMKILVGLAIVAILGFIFYSTSEAESTGRLGMLIDKFEVEPDLLLSNKFLCRSCLCLKYTSFVFFSYFASWRFGSYHNYCNIFSNFQSFFNYIKPV